MTFYEVPDEFVEEVIDRLGDWNKHGFWFELVRDTIASVDDRETELVFISERLLGKTKPAPKGFETDIHYRRFVSEMTGKLSAVFGGSIERLAADPRRL